MKRIRLLVLVMVSVLLCNMAVPGLSSTAKLPLAEHEAVYVEMLENCTDSIGVDAGSVNKAIPVTLDDGAVDIVYIPLAGVTFVIGYMDGELVSYALHVSQSTEDGAAVFGQMSFNLLIATKLIANPITITRTMEELTAALAEGDEPGVRTAETEVGSAVCELMHTSDVVTFMIYPGK